MTWQDTMIAMGLQTARAATGRSVLYHRDSQLAACIAIKAKHIDQALAQDTVISETVHTDWLFPVAELACFDPAYPAPGDWIEWEARRYDVTERPGIGYYSAVDPAGTWVRVVTTETGVA